MFRNAVCNMTDILCRPQFVKCKNKVHLKKCSCICCVCHCYILIIFYLYYLRVTYLASGGGVKNMYELLNLRALKFSPVNKIHIFQCIGKIYSAPSHYRDQCWPDSLTHICSTRGSWVNVRKIAICTGVTSLFPLSHQYQTGLYQNPTAFQWRKNNFND